MEVECEYCREINDIPRSHSIWLPYRCYNCESDLPMKTHRTGRYRSAYLRRPYSDDDTFDYPIPSRPLKIRDLSPPPISRIDKSIDTFPFDWRDSSPPVESRLYTPRITGRYEGPRYKHDRASDFPRERTNIYFDSFSTRSKLTVDKFPIPTTYSRDWTRSKPKVTREPSSTKSRFCSYQTLCQEYVWSLKWSREYFNSRHNRCYCSQCYPSTFKDVYIIAGKPYVIPRGWVRFGLHVDEDRAKGENIWDTWIVTYHGTKKSAAQSVIALRQFLLPGDTCDDGTVIGIREGHIPGKNHVYTSSTIKYSSLNCYCERYTYQAKNGRKYEAKIVLQCRQHPQTCHIQGETVGEGRRRICDIIPNEEIEIFTTVRAAVVPYGLLIQLTPV